MPKRQTPSQPSNSPKKKGKIAADQSSLDFFFSNKPSSGAQTSPKGKGKSIQREQPQPNDRVACTTPEVIDVDLLDDDGSPSSASLPSSQGTGTLTKNVPKTQIAFNDTRGGDHPLVYDTLSVDPVVFQPDGQRWPHGSPVPFAFLASTLSQVSQTRSRNSILNILTNSLRAIIHHHPLSLLPSIYLLSNSLSPPYSPVELGVGPSALSKAIQNVSGLTSAALSRLYKTTGDVGDVAYQAKSKVRTLLPHPPLTIPGVYESLIKIANSKGQGAALQKQNTVEKLLVSAKGEEVRFLARIISQNLRVGAVRTSILTALARALVLTSPVPNIESPAYSIEPEILEDLSSSTSSGKHKEDRQSRQILSAKFKAAEGLVRQVYVQHPNYDDIIGALLTGGLGGLVTKVPLVVGIPLHPALGSPMKSLTEIYHILDGHPFTAEFKYDGQRAQIHAIRENGLSKVSIFSRHLEDMTGKYPDIVSLVEVMFTEQPNLTSFIMDSEVVALDPIDDSLKSFQELSNRARKDVLIKDVQVQVGVFAFDLMYLNGEALLSRSFRDRRTLLRSNLPVLTPRNQGVARFDHVASCESDDGREAIQEFWEKAIENRCEGLMIKVLDIPGDPGSAKSRRKPLSATYEPDKRTAAWLKLKKDYVDGLGDSLDLVPIGAWHGNGRKASWWSPILLGVWDPRTGRHVAVCKCMSGFTDSFYKSLNQRYSLEDDSTSCSVQPLWDCVMGGYKPDVYFMPQEVWEIRGADITLSPTSVAALGLANESRGLSFRFPRFIRTREDKGVENASTPHDLVGLWRKQEARGVTGDDDGLVDIDFSDSENSTLSESD